MMRIGIGLDDTSSIYERPVDASPLEGESLSGVYGSDRCNVRMHPREGIQKRRVEQR